MHPTMTDADGDDNSTDAETTEEAAAGSQQHDPAQVKALAERISERTLLSPKVAETYVLYRRGLDTSDIATARGVGSQTISHDLKTVERDYARARTLAKLAEDDPRDEPEYEHLWDGGPELIAEHTSLTVPQAIVWVERQSHGRLGWYDPAAEAVAAHAGDDEKRARSTINGIARRADQHVENARETVELIELDGLFGHVVAATDVDAIDLLDGLEEAPTGD